MAVSTRNARQFGSLFQNRLENFGSDLAGDHVAAIRANFRLQAAKTLSGTGGELPHVQPLVRDPAVLEAGFLVLARSQLQIISVSTEDTIPGGAVANDGISFILLAPLAAGAVIFFTDRDWNGTTFAAAGGGEGTFTYTAGADQAAGTVVHISQAQLTTAGMALSSAGETIYAYQGTINAPTVFLHAVDIADGTGGFDGNELTNTGLVDGVSAVSLSEDNAEFGTRTHNIQIPDLVASINDDTNWVRNDNSPQDGTASGTPAFTAPDAQIWVAASGAGEGIVTINLDGTYNSGTLGYQIVQAFQNDANLFHPSDITLDTVEGKAFFVDSDISGGHNRIIQINISDLLNNPGSPLPFVVLYQDTGTLADNAIRTLSVDTQHNIIYFDHGSSFNKVVYNTALQTPTVLADLDSFGTNNYITQVSIDYATGQVLLGSSRVTTFGSFDSVSKNYLYSATGLTTASTTLTFVRLNFNPDDNDAGGPNNPNIPGLSGEAFPAELGTIRGIDIDTVNHIAYIVTGSVIMATDAGQSGSTTQLFRGGIYSYALTGNPNGDYTQLFLQDGVNGPKGLMYYIEVDPATGKYYVIDETGTNADPGDGAIFVGTLGAVAPPTFLATVGNFNGLGPQGLEIQHASTLAGTSLNGTYTETPGNPSPNGTAVTLANAFNAHDVDSEGDVNQDELAGAQVRISGNFQSGAGHADQLLVSSFTTGTNQNGTIVIGADTVTFSYNAASGVMTFTGITTLDNYENILGRVQFRTDGDNPTNYGSVANRTVSFSTFDGLLYSDEVNATITVTGVNDAPVNVVGGTTAATEDQSINVAGISVSDVDADPATQDIQVTLQVVHGTLTINTGVAGGVTAGDITGDGTGTIVITATQNQINATLAAATGLTYAPTGNYNGADTLTVTTSDLNQNGTGGAQQDSDVKAITIAAVNDAPTVIDATQTAATILEDTPGAGETVSSLFTASFSDALDQQQIPVTNPTGSVANTLAGIAVVGGSTGASGSWQYFNGASFVNIGAASTASAVLISAGTLIRFFPALNFNGAPPDLVVHLVDSSGAAITNGSTVNLTGATGGTTRYSATTVALSESVTAVNDAPVNTVGGTLTVAEDSGATNVTGMSISDVDANPATDIFSVTLDVLHGTLNLSIVVPGGVTAATGNGTATVTFTGTINQINATLAAAGGLTYTPTGNYNGSDRVQITTDDGGATGLDPGATGTATSESDQDSKTISVTAVNDPVTGTAPPTLTLAEDATNVAVAGLSISDVDATLAPAGVYEVTLSATHGTLTLTTLAGLTFSGGSDGTADAVMTFSGTLAAINTALATAQYTPAANYNGAATITLGVTDTFGGTVATGTGAATSDSDVINVTVTAVNDTPVVAVAASVGSIEQVAGTIDATATISDLELGALDNYGGSSLTVGRNGGAQPEDLLTFGASGAFTVNGANLETGAQVFATFTGGNGTPLVISFTSSATPATQALVNAVVQSLQYTYTGDNPPASIVMDYSFHDGAPANAGQGPGGSPIGTDAITINITDTPENAAPTLDLDGDDSNTVGTGYTTAFTEGGAAVLITDSDVAIADADLGDMIEGATIAINGPVAGDQLVLGAQGGFVVTGSGTGTITITGTGTAAQYQAMLAQITFTNTSDDPGTVRTINVSVTDGTAASNIAVSTINITPINDAPTLTATGGTPTFTEGDAAADLFSAVTASTIEAGQTFASLTLTVTNVTDGAGEILRVNGVDVTLTNGNNVNVGVGTATVTLAGSSATVVVGGMTLNAGQLQTLVDGLAYRNASEIPTDADRVVTITRVVDSGPDGGADVNNSNPNVSATVNVNPVNDAPLNVVPGTQTINEDASVTLSAGNGNPISVSDADATTLSVTLTVLHGTLTIASTLGLTFSGGSDGTADTVMSFSGTAAAINAALGAGLTYNPNANFNGSDTITVLTSDNGQTGGPTQTDSDAVTINITAINDAPVVIGDGTESATTINEDTPGAGQTVNALFAGQYSDAADNQIPNGGLSAPGAFTGVAVTANGSSGATGQWQYFSGGVWTNIGSVSDASAKLFGNTTLFRFNPATDFNGTAPTLTVHLVDNSLGFGIVDGMVVNASVTGGTTAYSAGTVVLSQDVTAINDAPLNTVPGAQTVNEDASFTLSTGNGNAIQVADVDASTLTVTLTVVHGTLTLASTAGLSFGTGDGTADLTMTFSGTAAAINAALGSGLTFNPTANYHGTDSIALLTTDNGQTGTGGTLQDNDSIGITINSVNDAPQGTDKTVVGSEDDPYVFTVADFGFSDPNDTPPDGFAAVRILTFPTNGTLFSDPDGPGGNPPIDLSTLGPLAFVSVATIMAGGFYFQPDPDEYGDNYASFTFAVLDNGGMANGGQFIDPIGNTITIDITPDNLPPVVDLNGVGGGINYTTTFVEDGAAVAIGAGVIVSDPDAGLGDLIESATITLTDRVAGDSLILTAALPPGITALTTPTAGAITIQITGPGTGAQYQALIQSIQYATTSQDPTVGGTDPARTITVTVNDGTIDSAVATTTVNVTAIDDLPVAQPDAFTITESGSIAGGNLFASNGSGADADPDGPPLSIAAVNGSAGNVNTTITLASGASLTVNANGTFNYNPGTAFLPTPTAGSGASNTPGHDSFTYTLAGGNTVTVSITLTGLDTNDLLLGTAGTDVLMGGLGNDTYYVENAADQVIEAAGQGFDAVYANVSYTLAAGTEVEWLSSASTAGTATLTLVGNELGQYLIGNDGINLLNGGVGADVMVGYNGNDTYYVDNAGDYVAEAAGKGYDAVYTTTSYALAAGQEVEWLSTAVNASTAALNLSGNEFAQYLVGNDGANVLNGLGGADVMIGLNGSDTYYVDNAGDAVIEAAGQGFDAVYTSVSYALSAGQEVEWLSTSVVAGTGAINLTGNEIGQYLIGNEGANALDGKGGADVMVGYGGNDTYYVDNAGDAVVENAGGGNDTVFSNVNYALATGTEVEFLMAANFASTAALNLTGNELANTIYGNAGANVLDGKGGNDLLVGQEGADTYAFTTTLGAGNVDILLGFEHGVDRIALDDAVFTAIGGLGGLNAAAFVTGSAAADGSDRIIYNSLTGQLFYDADGTGAGAQVQFATLSPGLTLTASDFSVI
jgi:Ca2+-binding RTX toxin-like protein